MNLREYQKAAIEFCASNRPQEPVTVSGVWFDILHFALGVSTEAGEILDAVKKRVAYGKPLDMVNIQEEIGDLLWYIAMFAERAGIDLELVMETNIRKLAARYKEKSFSKNSALVRDLPTERLILEKGCVTDPCLLDNLDNTSTKGSGDAET